jgi:ABC-type multidrug transport system fused ATPase/permease subunit
MDQVLYCAMLVYELLTQPYAGKSTLASIAMRILDFDAGELFINGTDIRRISPSDYHSRISAVFQGFSRFNASVSENIGVGRIDDLHSLQAIQRAVGLAGGQRLIKTLPNGLSTHLDASPSWPPAPIIGDHPMQSTQGLSGGQVSPNNYY